ncbi:unnamed protein product [Didymodactylos carnosus]|uniref:Uncharacterized protein n=1 Tax=Didymodactylos carnosus TaxID=1234261 RepID=A0A814E519_9BILA|nr:unnamed protein product [Didymodactylos carnosus]CAF1013392.1 unnamed protein product [Didymodactylos carnosus]CAF3737756.1 unnamed protein product [Didymodactylos carnosus]CAF3782303.1 unnamed protein product [Didymodactylos carnosus]
MIPNEETQVENDWLEFEIYSTNNYVREIFGSAPSSFTIVFDKFKPDAIDIPTDDQTRKIKYFEELSDTDETVKMEINDIRT